jgi:hypothetical protein
VTGVLRDDHDRSVTELAVYSSRPDVAAGATTRVGSSPASGCVDGCASLAAHRCHVPRQCLFGNLEFFGRAELNELAAGLGDGDVPWRHVERVAGFDDLFVAAVANGQLAGEQVSPVRALAAVIGKPFEQRAEVGALADGDEVECVAVEVLGAVFGDPMVDGL